MTHVAVNVPHFDIPFRYERGEAVVVEQDSERDVQNCVEAILRTEQGDLDANPDFGIPDLTLVVQPVDIGEIARAVVVQEPRAELLIDEETDEFDELISRVSTEISLKPEF